MKSALNNQDGQSFVQVLISAAIMVIIMTAMISIQSSQNAENRALGEKLSANDLARVVTAGLANGSICNGLFAPSNIVSGSMPFDLTNVSAANPYVIVVNQIPSGSTGPAIITAGAKASVLSNTLAVAPATASPPGIQVLVTSATSASLQVNFDQTKTIRSIHNLAFPLTIQTSGPVTSSTITGCGGQSSGILGNIQVFDKVGSYTFTVPNGVSLLQVEVWGGGGGGCSGAGGSGGAGGYSLCTMNVTGGSAYTVIVGDRGAAAGNWPGCPQNNGGLSSFSGSGASCSAAGGWSGGGGAGPGGKGTTSSSPGIIGYINLDGGEGSDLTGQNQWGGGVILARGGASPRGGDGGGVTGAGIGPNPIAPAAAPGGGGGAAEMAGDGAPGAVHVRW